MTAPRLEPHGQMKWRASVSRCQVRAQVALSKHLVVCGNRQARRHLLTKADTLANTTSMALMG